MLLPLVLGCSENNLVALGRDPPMTEPDIAVEPATVDFPSVAVGCRTESTVTVRNVGEATLDLTGVRLGGADASEVDAFTVESVDTLLWPGSALEVTLSFEPAGVGYPAAILDVTSDDPDDPDVFVPIAAAAHDGTRRLDLFHQDEKAVDVLWVIDNSGSMAQEKDRITEQIDEFIAWFDHLGLDYHMGVVTTDVVNPIFQGQLVGVPGYVTPDTPDAAAILGSAIQFDGVEMGNEAGLRAMEMALTEPLLSGANKGFYRPDARFAVIFVTDEPEQSVPDSAYYISFLEDLKPDPEDVFVAAIVGDRGGGCGVDCGTTFQTADAGDKYLDVADAFGGFEQSICTCNLAPALERMGLEATWYERTFPLTDRPADPAGIGVWVDGKAAGGWGYESRSNAIVFDTAPPVGSDVVARYPVAVECDD